MFLVRSHLLLCIYFVCLLKKKTWVVFIYCIFIIVASDKYFLCLLLLLLFLLLLFVCLFCFFCFCFCFFCLFFSLSQSSSIYEVKWKKKEAHLLFNDALNIYYLRIYDIRHMIKGHSRSERGNPLPPNRLFLVPINSKGYFICPVPHPG